VVALGLVPQQHAGADHRCEQGKQLGFFMMAFVCEWLG
jgi:hypothetical protein